MRPLLPFILLAAILLQDFAAPGKADNTDWADCLSCHAEISTGLPELAALRPRPNALTTRDACNSCHERSVPDFFAGDWSHPARTVGEHIGCDACHPAVPHSSEFPPPVPTGDYRAQQCYECHSDTGRHVDSLSSHVNDGLTACIDCHPPHSPLRALIPDPLLPLSLRERRGDYSRPEDSNAPCMDCHSGFDLFTGTQEGFVTLNTENYHRLHVVGNDIGCIECHDPHGSMEHALMRRTLLTGELLTYIPDAQGASCSVTCHGATHNALPYVNRMR